MKLSPMKFLSKSVLAAVAVAFATSLAFTAATSAPAEAAKKVSRPLKGTIYYKQRRIGGYSYKYVDGIDTRRFVDRSMTAQSSSGPFDSGFFFTQPWAPHGGDTPYMH